MENKDKFFLFQMKNKLMGFVLGYFKSIQKNDNTINLSKWQFSRW